MGVKRTGDLLEKLTWGFAIGLVVLSLGAHVLTQTTTGPVQSMNQQRAQETRLPAPAAATRRPGAPAATPGGATAPATAPAATPVQPAPAATPAQVIAALFTLPYSRKPVVPERSRRLSCIWPNWPVDERANTSILPPGSSEKCPFCQVYAGWHGKCD